ncbi:MAG: hypothetical protein JKY37_03195, partial [Nannocystaceae bacterium]|nr:hypothetical protein [Nannocystaceae bacterium]
MTLALVALLSAVGCRKQPAASAAAPSQPVPGLTLVPLEGGPTAATPNLTVGSTGIVALTWQQTAGESHSVRSRLRDAAGRWGATVTVAESDTLLVNWADFPVLLANGGGHRVASWLQRDGRGYGVQWSHSEDDGTTWAPTQWLHLHQGGPEYGFVSVTPTQTGGLAAFWLDGRESVGDHGGAMQLRGAEIGADGTVSARRLIDDRVCDCCQTSAASTAAGPVVVYRDRSAQEVRDISIAGPEVDQRRRVAADDWTIAGCPVNGPAVSASKA